MTTLWQSERVSLVSLMSRWGGETRPPTYPVQPHRRVRRVILECSGTAHPEGREGACEYVRQCRAPVLPGTSGRGLGGTPWAIVVPEVPATAGGRVEAYCVLDERVSHPEQGPHADDAIRIGILGTYRSRHLPGSETCRWAPDSLALTALDDLVAGYLLPRYGLPLGALYGAHEAGQPWSPGDYLEQWVRHFRKEPVPPPSERDIDALDGDADRRSLRTLAEREEALAALGYATGPAARVWGAQHSAAVRAFQAACGAAPSGAWCRDTEGRIRHALERLR